MYKTYCAKQGRRWRPDPATTDDARHGYRYARQNGNKPKITVGDPVGVGGNRDRDRRMVVLHDIRRGLASSAMARGCKPSGED